MSRSVWRAVLAGCLVSLAPLAAAQPQSCSSDLMAASYRTDETPEAARLRCDLDRAAGILDRASELYASRVDALVEIIDTASPSGAAYVYSVVAEGANLRLQARSVPDGRGPRCELQAALPDETASSVSQLLSAISSPAIPDYGPREEVTVNPDGSRSLRLIIDSHDIITHAETPAGIRSFSRHAGSSDPVSRLNQLVIDVANVSPGWTCAAS
jgi:hypothetical protein